MRGDKGLSDQRAIVVDQLGHQAGEHRVGGLRAELVALQAVARLGGGKIDGSGRRVAEPQHGPTARRNVPRQAAVLEMRGQVDDLLAGNRLLGRQRR